jgi:hypothetical protein
VKNNGKEAERAFAAYWESVGHVERLRDKKDLMGLNKNMKLADFAKPSDFLVSSQYTPLHYAEVKSTTNPTLFSFAKIQPAQSAAALKEANRGNGSYFFYIFSYERGQWFMMSCYQYFKLLGENRRSVKFEELEQWNAIR